MNYLLIASLFSAVVTYFMWREEEKKGTDDISVLVFPLLWTALTLVLVLTYIGLGLYLHRWW